MQEISFNTILKNNRKMVDMTQVELATKTKIERTYMSKLESEKSNPAFSTIKKLCEGLGMSVSEFFYGTELDKSGFTLVKNRKEDKIKRRKLNWSGILWDLLLGIVGGIAIVTIGTMLYLMLGGKL